MKSTHPQSRQYKRPRRRLEICVAAILVVSGMASVAAAAETEATEAVGQPDIVLVMSDDQGWGQTGYNGHPLLKTPHLDAMSAAGMTFHRFYAGGPVCSPTRASVLTGRTPCRTGVLEHGYALRRQEISIASVLKQAGYTTAHFGKWHLDGIRGPGVPILLSDRHGPANFGFDRWLSVTNFFDRDPLMSREGIFESFVGDSSEVVVEQAVDYLQKTEPLSTPRFVVIWFGSPHSPFVANQEDRSSFDSINNDSASQSGEIVAMDRAIGKLRHHIAEQERSTLLWFCSDNGGLGKIEPSTVKNLRGYKGSLYEGGIRVPSIIQWSGRVPPASQTDTPCGAIDIFPTLAEVAGVAVPSKARLDGQSLVSWFNDPPSLRAKPLYFQYRQSKALIDNRWKLLCNAKGSGKSEACELYDLATDPAERQDRSNDSPEISQRLRQKMSAIASSVARSMAGEDYPDGLLDQDYPAPRPWYEIEAYQPYIDLFGQRTDIAPYLKRSGVK